MNPVLQLARFTLFRLAARPFEAVAISFLCILAIASSFILPRTLDEPVVVSVLLSTGIPLIGYLAISEASRFFVDYRIFQIEIERGVASRVGEIQFGTIVSLITLVFGIQAISAVITRRLSVLPALEYFLILVFSLCFSLRLVLVATRRRVREELDLGLAIMVVPLMVLATYCAYIGIGAMVIYAFSWSMLSALTIGVIFSAALAAITVLGAARFAHEIPRSKL